VGAQLGKTAGITGVPEGTHTEIPGVPGQLVGDKEILGVPGPPVGDIGIPGVPDGGTHNEIPGVPDGIAAGSPEVDAAVPDDTTAGVPEGDPTNLTDTEEDGTMMDHNDSSTSQPENDNTGVIEDTSDSGDEDEEETDISDSEVYHPESMTPSIQRVYGLRPNRARDYSHLHANVVHHAMTQYSLKRALNKFKVKAEEAASKELMQLHMKDTFEPQDVKALTGDQKKSALESLMFLKEKREGTIKGRMCADGRKQREGSTKSDATSPTVALESVLITANICAFERRYVAIVDVPGAFQTADMDEKVIMCLRGRLAEPAPNIYRKFISIDNKGSSILYVKLQKALYGCLRSAFMFYLKLVKDLETEGYELNPYDPCMANKIVAGAQFTKTWHIDDLKLSHASSDEVTKTIEWLKSIYGQDMRVSRGKKHDYLGMDLDYSNDGEVKITMINYLKGFLEDFPEAIVKTAATPAAGHLFTIRPEG
jgi:hypothetical protein